MTAGYDFEGKRVFLSGPMTGLPGYNRAAFADAERRLRWNGAAAVYNPAAEAGRYPDAAHGEWMTRTLHLLTTHRDIAAPDRADRRFDQSRFWDVLALLPGGEASEGARAERAVAQACGIEVIELG